MDFNNRKMKIIHPPPNMYSKARGSIFYRLLCMYTILT